MESTNYPIKHTDSQNVNYLEYEDYVSVSRSSNPWDHIIIPETLNGKKITELGKGAFIRRLYFQSWQKKHLKKEPIHWIFLKKSWPRKLKTKKNEESLLL